MDGIALSSAIDIHQLNKIARGPNKIARGPRAKCSTSQRVSLSFRSPGLLKVGCGRFKILLQQEQHINITPIVLDGLAFVFFDASSAGHYSGQDIWSADYLAITRLGPHPTSLGCRCSIGQVLVMVAVPFSSSVLADSDGVSDALHPLLVT